MADADHRDFPVAIRTANRFETDLKEDGEFLRREPRVLHPIPLSSSIQHGRDHTGVMMLWEETLQETGAVRRGHRGTDIPEVSHDEDHLKEYQFAPAALINATCLFSATPSQMQGFARMEK
jgi:hypothetical protein